MDIKKERQITLTLDNSECDALGDILEVARVMISSEPNHYKTLFTMQQRERIAVIMAELFELLS